MMRVRTLMLPILSLILSACATGGGDGGKAIGLKESSPAEVYVKLGVRYMELGQMDVALSRMEQAIKVDPKYSQAHNAIAVLYERLELPDTARGHFEQAMDLNPSNVAVLTNYGRFLCERGEYDKADRLFSRAIAMPLNKRPWLAMANAGRCLRRAGKDEEAEKQLREVLERNPKFAPALLDMLEISFQNQQYLSARAFLQRYLEVAQHTPKTLWLGIQSEMALGNQALVDEYSAYLNKKFPQSPEAAKLREMNR
ncbi:MAG: type IV pilus biogenesis/stability protein PilW [Pseudomonadota bacterium]